jgi:hypothetical protein
MRNRVVGDFEVNIARWRARLAYHFCDRARDDGGTCSKSGRVERLEERVVTDCLGFLWPKMDDKFFVLWDGRWAHRMDHDMNKGDLFQVHLAAVADQVR